MGLGDKLIQRLEQQSETLAELRRLEEKHRGRICELERKLVDAEREQDIARVEIETLRQERDLARVYDGNTVAQWHQKACEYSAELRAIWTQMMQVDIAFPEEKSLVQSVQILRESHDAARAEIETLRKQLANAQREASDEFAERQVLTAEQQEGEAAWRQQLDAAQAALTRERLNADEQGREIETLQRTERELTQAYSDACQDANRLVCVEQDLLAEIDTLRQQLANAQREAVNLQKLHDHLRPRLDAAQGQLTRERLDAEEQGRELERLWAFVELARGITPRNSYAGVEMLRAALDELDAGTSEPAPVAETLDAEGGA